MGSEQERSDCLSTGMLLIGVESSRSAPVLNCCNGLWPGGALVGFSEIDNVSPIMKLDLHTHFYTEEFFQTIRDLPSEFSFGTSSTGQTIITYRGARFFGVTPAMTDVSKRIEDMDRVGIDVEVVSLSTPNVFFTDAEHQPQSRG